MMTSRGLLCGALAVALALLTSPVAGQPAPLIVATGDPGGTYVRFFDEIQKACPDPPLRGVPSKGSVENLERVMNNEANVGFVQIDVLFAKRLVDHDPAVENIRTLLVLYLEEIHIIIPATSASTIKDFVDLAGKRVGVYGGSDITARILFAITKVAPASLRDFSGPQDALRALGTSVDAILGVGGTPLPWVAALTSKYKLVPFNEYAKVSNIYFPAVLDYSNLDQPGGIQTIGVPSLLITRNYQIPEMTTPLVNLRNCIVKNLETLRETVGNAPKWGQVDPSMRGPWPYFQPPTP
jgi:TRAP transporter TAXI family solute receptor